MSDRLNKSNEIFIGVIKPVGINTEDIIHRISDILGAFFNYNVEVINISKDIIPHIADNNEKSNQIDDTEELMDIGNEIRLKHGNDSLAKFVSAKISLIRTAKYDNDFNKRVAYIITSLKNPAEIKFLRDLYSSSFVVIGILRSLSKRKEYLGKLEKEEKVINELLHRDKNEEVQHGQKFRDTFYLSDFFVNYSDEEALKNQLIRFFELLFGNPYITPSFDEVSMHAAFSASLRSADLSRQVGAVIAKDNEIIAQGANDCPKFGGGLYWPKVKANYTFEDADNGRDFERGFDSNKRQIYDIYDNILKCLGLEENKEEYINKLEKSKIKSLTEFGRSVHAEMEAISMCARNLITSKDATLYCTTFPCHNCTKHIVASGIIRVVYVEPYPKSKAKEFYNDSIYINENLDDINGNKDRVIFEPYIGVGPRLFNDLFSINYSTGYSIERKDERGNVIKWKAKTANYRLSMEPYGYIDKENALLMHMLNKK